MFPIIPLPGGLYLPSYFLVITIGYCIGIYWLYLRAEKFELSIPTAMDSAILIMVGGFIGSRLFHVFFELPQFYIDNPTHILKIWQGGFVFYGGAIGAVLPVIWLMKTREEPIPLWLDAFAPIIPLVYAIGRFATLLSGSGYGKPTNLPWGISYPAGSEAPVGILLHPTPVYAVLWELVVLVLTLWLLNKQKEQDARIDSGFAFGFMVLLHGIGRAVIEQFRDDFRGNLILQLSVSTWISMIIIIAGATLCSRCLKTR